MRPIALIFFACLTVFNLHAQQRPNTFLMQISDLAMNLEFEKANKQIDDYLKKNPNDPLGWFTRESIKFWEASMYPDNESISDQIVESADKAIEHAEELSEKNPNNPYYYFILGGAHGFKGLSLAQFKGSMLKAAWAGKKGNDNLKKCLELDPNYEDNYLGLGIFTYMVGRIPNSYRWIVKIIGFDGDRDLGLSYMKRVTEKGIYTKTISRYFYAQYLSWENRFDESTQYYKDLTEKYPNNAAFRFSLANVYLNNDKPELAVDQYRLVMLSPFEKRFSRAKNQAIGISFEMGNEDTFKEALNFCMKEANNGKDKAAYANLAYEYLILNRDLNWISEFNNDHLEQMKKLGDKNRKSFYDNKKHSAYFVTFWDALKLYHNQDFGKSNILISKIPESELKNWQDDEVTRFYQIYAQSARKAENHQSAIYGYTKLRAIYEKNEWKNPVSRVDQRLLELYVKANKKAEAQKVLDIIKQSELYGEFKTFKEEIDSFSKKSGLKV